MNCGMSEFRSIDSSGKTSSRKELRALADEDATIWVAVLGNCGAIFVAIPTGGGFLVIREEVPLGVLLESLAFGGAVGETGKDLSRLAERWVRPGRTPRVWRAVGETGKDPSRWAERWARWGLAASRRGEG